MNRERIAANLLIVATGQGATWLMTMVSLVIIGRYFGPWRLGEVTLAASIVALLGLTIGLGMETLITRSAARAPERIGVLVRAGVAVRATVAIPALGVLVGYTAVAGLNAETRALTLFLAAGTIVGSFSGLLGAVLQGQERMSLTTLGPVFFNLCELVIIAVVVALHGSIVAVVALYIPVLLVLLLLNCYWLRHDVRLSLRIAASDMREVLVGSLPFWATGVFLTIYIVIDSIILSSLAGTRATGIYAPATRMFAVALFLPAILGQVTLPLLSRRGIDAGADFMRTGREVLSLLIACGVPLCIGLATFAGPLILTLYGPAYRLSIPVLMVLSLCIVPTFMNIQGAQTLAACNRQWRWTIVMAVSCLANPLINLWLIPYAAHRWHNPALGAALALLATELLMAAYAAIVLHRMFLTRAFARVLLASLAAGAVQLSVVLLAAPLWSPLAEACGLAVYTALALAFGALPRDGIGLLLRIARRRIHLLSAIRVSRLSPQQPGRGR